MTRALEKATTVEKRRRVWEEVFGRKAVKEIYSCHSNEEEKLHSCANIYVTCKPDSSWEELIQKLYDNGEMAAIKEAKAFVPQKGRCLILYIVHLNLSCVFRKIVSYLHACMYALWWTVYSTCSST